MQQGPVTSDFGDIPPIVLILDPDRDAVARYSSSFESAEMWVATSAIPTEALDAARELRPDLIVMHVEGSQEERYDHIHMLRGAELA